MIIISDLIATIIDIFLIAFFSEKWIGKDKKAFSVLRKTAYIFAFLLLYLFANLCVVSFFETFVGGDSKSLLFGRSLGHYLLLYFAKFLYAVIASLLLILKNKRENDERLRTAEFVIKTQSDYLEKLKTNTLEIRKIRHDINKYLDITSELIKSGKTEKAIDYISGISEKIKTAELITTKSDIVSAVLSLKYAQSIEKNIKFTYSIIGKISDINENDLAILLYNLLDNAIEAAEHTDSPLIDINITEDKAYLKIIIKNSALLTVLSENKLPKTSKEDKNLHGFGLLTVSDVVKKHNGLLNLTIEDDVFIADIRLRYQSK